MGGRARAARLVLVAAGIAAALVLNRDWPKRQTVHYRLGRGAPGVRQIEARWSDARAPDETLRAVTFRFADGGAPRIVTDEARLADGDYDVDFSILSVGGPQSVVRRVALRGGAASIDLADRVDPAQNDALPPRPANPQ
jgi:hypothetical protein